MLVVKNLKCEYLENPIGIDRINPRLSWQIVSDKRNVKQQQFQIQVATDEEFNNVVWNMHTFSEKSIHIPYEGAPLESKIRYFYRVKIWISKEEESDWSDTCFWEMGLINTSEWKAEWISVKEQKINEDFKARSPFSCFKNFTINKDVKKAVVYVTSLGVYELYINEKRVGKDYLTPGWTDYNYRIQYQTYEVSDFIKAKDNKLNAIIGEGWYSGYLGWTKKKDTYGSKNTLLLQMHIYYEDGTSEVLVSDESWKEEKCNILMSDIYNGEIYDAREKEDTNIYSDLVIVPYPKTHLIAQENEPIRIQEEIEPLSIFKTPKGESVLDMGQNMAGFVRFKINGEKGQKVTLIHGEVLDKDGNFYRDNIRDAAQKVTYICNGNGEELYEPHFTFQGFRYVKLEGFPKDIKISDFTGVVLHSDMQPIGNFETSDKKINQLQHNILWGQKGNFIDVPTDCPQRDERLGWTGDAQIFARTACFNMNVAPFFSKWLKDLSCNQMSDGAVPFVVPDILKGTFADGMGLTTAGWGDAAVICPWTIYQCYGDENILIQQYDSMKNWINYIRNQGEDEYLWDTGLQLADWLALDNAEGSLFGATDGYLVSTAYYAYSTGIFAKIAKVLGKFDDYKLYSQLYDSIKEAYINRFFDEEGNLTSETQTAQVISLYFDLAPEKYKENVAKKLVELIEKKNMHLDTGFLGTPYICHVLSDNGYEEVAYKLLFNTDYPSWLYQVERGATTMWEHWDSIKVDGSFWDIGMNSFNHYSYGSVGAWMYQNIGGLDMLESGYKKSKIALKLTKKLSYTKAALETMYGKISVDWEIAEDKVNIKVVIPHNTTSIITLPKVKNIEKIKKYIIEAYNEKRLHIDLTNGLSETYIDTDFGFKIFGDNISFEIGSGSYNFSYEYTHI